MAVNIKENRKGWIASIKSNKSNRNGSEEIEWGTNMTSKSSWNYAVIAPVSPMWEIQVF